MSVSFPCLPLWGRCHAVTEGENNPSRRLRATLPKGEGFLSVTFQTAYFRAVLHIQLAHFLQNFRFRLLRAADFLIRQDVSELVHGGQILLKVAQ